ncbi:AGAP004553-PA-like protein [Anopheles sinensis]|uniref:AGAP004553-PA-like protein n=1 Tax=Anopheles sinensis TaxID=74873 RepID=A0A084WTU3_ANOSI|nr:AGAP004553-PA-like protein [Anopheles sinensis]
MDPSTDGLRSNDVYGVDASVLGHRADTKSREFKYAIYAMLKQLMEESAANRQELPTHLQQQQSGHQQPSFQRDLSGVTDV